MIAFAGSLPAFSLMGTSQAIFSSWQAFRWLAAFLLLERILTLALTVLLLSNGWSVVGLVVAVAVAQALTGLASAVVAMWILARDGSFAWWRAQVSLISSLRSDLAAMFSWNYAINHTLRSSRSSSFNNHWAPIWRRSNRLLSSRIVEFLRLQDILSNRWRK